MRLAEIRLSDFRCFYGESIISFSLDDAKNVTIIYAENGVGKTTLLNALLWCFFGETTSRFEKKEDILNYDAKKKGRTTASVEVQFEHDDSYYIAKRFFGLPPGSRSFVVARIDRGSQVNIDTPDTFINTVIPRDMASHFLFDGEHAEIFLGEKNLRSAVRDILGCSLVETAIEDLQAVSAQFRRLIPSTPATVRISELNAKLDTLSNQIESAAAEVQRLEDDRAKIGQQIADIEAKLRNTGAAKELQRERDRLDDQLRRARKRQVDCADEVFKWLGENGRFVVSKRITEEAFEFLDEREHRGRLPSPYNEEFVRDILTAMRCICGAHLEPGSSAAREVAKLLEKAANQTMRDRVAKVRARLSNLKTERAKAHGRLKKAQDNKADVYDEISIIEAHLGEVSEKLKGINLEDIAGKERRREELLTELSKVDRSIGALKSSLELSDREKINIDKEINQLALQDKETAVFSSRRNLCDQIRAELERELLEEEDHAREVLRSSMRKILKSTTRKPFNLQMTDRYEISLINSEGTVLPKSSGENQLLGLAFISALVGFAKIRSRAKDYRLLPGTIAPLVLDSPFGQLDEAYRATTASFIPKMASQVVLLLSKSQASPEVLRNLQGCVGQEYVLIRHNRGAPTGEGVETRELGGKTIRTAIFDSAYDGTEIMKVSEL